MFQTETLLLVALGFSLAALIALFLGRLVWVVALRIGARRMQRQVPSTVADLQVERDRLRADYARLSQRLGERLEAVKLRMAEHMAEVNRHRNRLEAAESALAEKAAEVDALRSRIAELEQLTATQAQGIARLETTVAERDRELAALRRGHDEARSATPRAPAAAPPAASAQSGSLPASLAERIARLNRLAQNVAAERQHQAGVAVPGDMPSGPSDAAAVDGTTDGTRQETLDIEKELARLDAEWSKRLEELPRPAGDGDTVRPRAVATVISLANRIRALQKEIGKG